MHPFLDQIETRLPWGIPTSGRARLRNAVLRPLDGRDEAWLLRRSPTSRNVTALLQRCALALFPLGALTAKQIDTLPRSDRQHLVLQLYAAALGDTLTLDVSCPDRSCAASLRVALSISTLCAHPHADASAIAVETAQGPVMLRPPNGEDDAFLETLPPLARAPALWQRLVIDSVIKVDWSQLSASIRHQLALALQHADRGPRLTGEIECPRCGAIGTWRLSPLAALMAALRPGTKRLVEEIHHLALWYHWTEEDILALPRHRRHRYLQLLCETT